MSVDAFNSHLHSDFPIAKAMGAEVRGVDSIHCSVQVPLAPNINHKGTVFGGSLYSASALSCYGLVLFGLQSRGIKTDNVVIAQGEMKYIKPVTGNFEVIATWESTELAEEFFKTLLKKGKARTSLRAQVILDAQVCAQFNAQFVAMNPIVQSAPVFDPSAKQPSR
jgi:thioesterase domain-containing protein